MGYDFCVGQCFLKYGAYLFRFLVEQKEVEVNVRDKWDSTPLYYACLCGHIDLVRYLLENGWFYFSYYSYEFLQFFSLRAVSV